MSRSPLALAALATVAVPGLDVVDVRAPRTSVSGFDVAIVIDSEQRRWVIRAPQDPTAGIILEAEVAMLRTLGPQSRTGALPFAVPEPSGFARLLEGGRAVVWPMVAGRKLQIGELIAGTSLPQSIGAAIGAIHNTDPATLENASLTRYSADEYRAKHLAELDAAAQTGRVPAKLLARWEEKLENVALWHFHPILCHGSLSAEQILVRDGEVVAIEGWANAQIADPADDLSWIVVAADPAAAQSILTAYREARPHLQDPHLTDRARLVGELALISWLLHGVHSENEEIIADAEQMLDDLVQHIEQEEAFAAQRAAELEAERRALQAAEAARIADEQEGAEHQPEVAFSAPSAPTPEYSDEESIEGEDPIDDEEFVDDEEPEQAN